MAILESDQNHLSKDEEGRPISDKTSFHVTNLGIKAFLTSKAQFDENIIQTPHSLESGEWQRFIDESGQRTDLLRFPITYPGFSGTYLVVNRPTARKILLMDFEGADIFRGEREFFASFQGNSIFRQSDREGWQRARREINPYFSPHSMHEHANLINHVVLSSTEDLVNQVRDNNAPTSKIFKRFVAQTLVHAHLGVRQNAETIDRLVESFNAFYKAAPALVLGLDRFRPIRDFVLGKLEPYNQVVERIVEEALILSDSGLILDFLKGHQDNSLDWFHTVFAGQSSLATSLEWITYSLAVDDQAQSRLRNALGSHEYDKLVGEFLEKTASNYPTPTFLLRKTLASISTDSGNIPANSLIIVPLFAITGGGKETEGIPSEGMYDLQFSPGLRRCLGRYMCEAIHRDFITSLLANTNRVSCLNRPNAIMGLTVSRPSEDFQFVFS